MPLFRDTQEAADFIATAPSRETSPRIMEAIVFFARDIREAEGLWNGDLIGQVCQPIDLWEYVTGNGRDDAADYVWGASGSHWWRDIQPEC